MEQTKQLDSLSWAAEKGVDLTVSIAIEKGWANLRSRFIRYDSEEGLLEIEYPLAREHGAPTEIPIGTQLGISFRRGHKKCIFASPVVVRRRETDETGRTIDTLVLRMPDRVRELQRRVFQRVTILPEKFIAAKLWEGGVPNPNAVGWPLCSGRVVNISAGGIRVDIRADQNPRLCTGDVVGIEITAKPGSPAILVDGQYRHCLMEQEDRLGLGFQFVGLEHDVPGRSTLIDVADYVRRLRRGG